MHEVITAMVAQIVRVAEHVSVAAAQAFTAHGEPLIGRADFSAAFAGEP
jgi:hypothetical protein